MLNALRKGAATWVAKIFIAVLVLSFAVWGVADIFGGYGRTTLATVGDLEITGEEYQFNLRAELRNFGARFGRTLTLEEARALGLDRQVLQRMIGDATLESQGSQLSLGITDKAIVELIRQEKIFKDATGRFNEQIFREILRTNNLTEQSYVARQRRASVRRQLTRTVTETVPLPKTLLAAADLYRNEERTLRYMALPASKLETIEDPTEEVLKTYYDGNKRSFVAPEYRKLGILPVTVDSVSDRIEVTEEEVKAHYDTFANRYTTPERRRVLQITFPDKAAAQAAYDKTKAGTGFIEIAKERGFQETDIDLGLIAKTALADKAIADAAFALAKDEISTPVVGGLATVLLKVTEIEAEVVRTFEQVKDEIRRTIATERAAEEVLDLSEKIEEQRAGEIPLPEIAEKLGLKYLQIEAVDRDGNDLKGVAVNPLPGGTQLLRTAFESEVDTDNDPVETQDRGLVWVTVLGVTPERQKTFEEVREDVITAWRDGEIRARLSKKAQELLDKAKGGTSLDEIAKALELEVKETAPATRLKPGSDVPQTVVTQAFALSEGGFGSAPSDDGKSRIVFQVTKVTKPEPLDAKKAKELEQTLASSLADDLVNQYVSGLRTNFGVTINQALFDELTGRRFAERGGAGY